MFSTLFHTILYQPILNIFVFIYNIIPGHDIGVTILIITILVRALVYPLMSSSIKSQKSVQDLQPKLKELKEKYKDDKQKQAAATMQLYKENKVNPFASCLPLIVQLPILIALYMVMRAGLMSDNLGSDVYSFIFNPGKLNNISFWIFDMAKANIVLAVFAGAAQYFQTKAMLVKQPPKDAGEGAKDEQMMAVMNKQMLYFMPVMTVFIGATLPAGLTLYWFFSTLLTWAQQVFIYKQQNNK
ncbi:MAG: YidC/Oxa1 family membrane protein insertase [Candidatus Magasanikbacteria bacterium]|nr:YidC/Oxa1 family membrane protein insertase [Candidatus Magasanikbacteria bacterium]